MKNPIQSAGEAVPAPFDEAYYANWRKARALGKELSEILQQVGDSEFAFIRPANNEFAVCFGGFPHDGPDPLLAAIDAYKAGFAAYRAMPDDETDAEEAAIAASYGPPLAVLDNWDTPARSREAVVAALELIKAEHLAQGLGITLIDACIPFIRGEMI